MIGSGELFEMVETRLGWSSWVVVGWDVCDDGDGGFFLSKSFVRLGWISGVNSNYFVFLMFFFYMNIKLYNILYIRVQ